MRSYSEAVRSNRIGEGLLLKVVEPGQEVVISDDDWNNGAKMWNFTLLGKVVSHSPSYAEMVKWYAFQ